MNKDEIIEQSVAAFNLFSARCEQIPDNAFSFTPAEKWSIAQNLDHLIRSMKPTQLAFALPKFIIRMYGGKPNRPSRTYEELVAKYKQKLAAGGRASGRFVPAPAVNTTKNALLIQWKNITAAYLKTVQKKWKDENLDNYIIPHPLLGKITLRELAYFTIYHTQHHQQAIEERLAEMK